MVFLKRPGFTQARLWHLVDAQDKDLDTIASRIATALKGSANTSSNQNTGDFVVVINARLVKPETTHLVYKWSTGWPGGKRELMFKEMIDRHPTLPLLKAVYRNLSKEEQKRRIMERLKVFPDGTHPYAQNIYKDYTDGKESPRVNLADSE